MPTKTKRNAQPKAADAAGTKEEPQPERSPDELRAALTLKLACLVGRYQWPACPRRGCRRHRSCEAPNYMCANPRPARPMTPEKERAVMGHFFRALKRRAAALGVEKR